MVNLIPNSPKNRDKEVLKGQPEGFNFAERLYNQARGRDPDADVEYRGPDVAKELYNATGGNSGSDPTKDDGPLKEAKDFIGNRRRELPDLNVNDVFQDMPDERQLSDAVIERHPFFNQDEDGDIGINTPGLDIPGLPGVGDVSSFNPFNALNGLSPFDGLQESIEEASEFTVKILAIIVGGILAAVYLRNR